MPGPICTPNVAVRIAVLLSFTVAVLSERDVAAQTNTERSIKQPELTGERSKKKRMALGAIRFDEEDAG